MIGNLVGEHDSICLIEMNPGKITGELKVVFNRGVTYYVNVTDYKIIGTLGIHEPDSRDLAMMKKLISEDIE